MHTRIAHEWMDTIPGSFAQREPRADNPTLIRVKEHRSHKDAHNNARQEHPADDRDSSVGHGDRVRGTRVGGVLEQRRCLEYSGSYAGSAYGDQLRLKYCTARSCFSAAAREPKVPRFRRLPVFGFFFREYSRYFPSFSFRIIAVVSRRSPAVGPVRECALSS